MGSALGVGWGVVVGSLVVFCGATIGATICFFVARFVLHDFCEKLVSRSTVASSISKALGRDGLRVVVLLRLSPLIPFNVMNFVSGAAPGLRSRDFIIGSVGMAPAIVAYVYLAAAFGAEATTSSNGDGNWIKIGLISAGVLASMLAVVVISRRARQELQNMIEVGTDSYIYESRENESLPTSG